MKQQVKLIISHLVVITFAVIIIIKVLETTIIISPLTFMALLANKAIQSLPGANAPILVSNACEQECMNACVFNKKCMAYMFDENDGSCKIWDHLVIQLIDRPKAQSWMQSMPYSLVLPKLV